MKGTVVNAAAVLLGGGLGLLLGRRLPERVRGIITDGLGLATVLVLSGITAPDDPRIAEIAPDLVLPSIRELIEPNDH